MSKIEPMWKYLMETKVVGIPLILHIVIPPIIAYRIVKIFT